MACPFCGEKQLWKCTGSESHLGVGCDDELEQDCPELVKLALEKQLLINVTAGNVIRLLPPLIINQQQADMKYQESRLRANTLVGQQRREQLPLLT